MNFTFEIHVKMIPRFFKMFNQKIKPVFVSEKKKHADFIRLFSVLSIFFKNLKSVGIEIAFLLECNKKGGYTMAYQVLLPQPILKEGYD